jgi:signal peptidase I
MHGDTLLVWRPGDPSPGDIIVFEPPDAPGRRSVSRVLAVGPAEVGIDNLGLPVRVGSTEVKRAIADEAYEYSDLRADGALPRTRRLAHETAGDRSYRVILPLRRRRGGGGARTVEVPAGTLFVVNDNRSEPAPDSRTFGPLPLARVTGVAERIFSAGTGVRPEQSARGGCSKIR